MVTVAAAEVPPRGGLKLESLTHIDISKLSQSELHALSLCSDAAFDLGSTNDVLTPGIDPAVFNESAGSRRQTYSRHSSAASGHRCRLPGLLPNNPRTLPPGDPERAENKSIVNFLKHLIGGGETENPPPPLPQPVVSGNAENMQIVLYPGEKKRKRVRKPKPEVPGNGGEEIRLEIVNKNGVAVDLKALLEKGDEIYDAELRKRTVGLESEDEVLGFLRDLEGQWGSRRKRRRIVDAGEFDDALPVGWKLLLGLKRREGRVSVYCRRYISPNGQQFVSCKDASSYLQSYFGLTDASQQLDQTGDNNTQVYGVASENAMGFLMGIDNLPEVQVRDIFECYKCNMTFDEKDPYLKHLMSFHQKTTRRYRLGSSIGEGVIIKDGQYECQICHKVFQERRSYNGHVGVHVRNSVRNSEGLPGEASASQDKLPPRISKMDALIEIAQSSILETSAAETNDKANDGSSPHKLKVVTVPETIPAKSDHELRLGSDLNEPDLEDCVTKSIPDHSFNQHDVHCIMSDKENVNSDLIPNEENNATEVCTGTFESPKLDEVENRGNSEGEIGVNSQISPSHDVVTWFSGQTVKENVLQSGIADSSTMVPSLHCFPSSTAISNKAENEFYTLGQKLYPVTGFEIDDPLQFNFMNAGQESPQFSFMNGQESPSLPGVSMNMANDEGMEEVFNSSARFESEEVMLNINGRRQFTTVCVWCRTEFNYEAFESETQSDSVGFMCPACKAKISGQLNVLDSGLSMNPHL